MKSWIKRILLVLGIVLIGLLAALIIFIKMNIEPDFYDENGVPKRPAEVPADHQWHGGLDGGEWIHCRPESDSSKFHCSIYNMVGNYYSKGLFIPSRPVSPPFEIISGGWSHIGLKDQKGDDVILQADGWHEEPDGKIQYKNGELVETP